MQCGEFSENFGVIKKFISVKKPLSLILNGFNLAIFQKISF